MIKYIYLTTYGESDKEDDNSKDIFAASAKDGRKFPVVGSTEGTTSKSIDVGDKGVFIELAELIDLKEPKVLPVIINLVIAGEADEIFISAANNKGEIVLSGIYKTDIGSFVPSIQSTGSILELLDVYPNPSSGLFKISYVSASQDKKEIRIVNQLGQLVKTIHLEQSNIGLNTIDMDVKGLIEGMYHVQLISGDEVKSKKIIIK